MSNIIKTITLILLSSVLFPLTVLADEPLRNGSASAIGGHSTYFAEAIINEDTLAYELNIRYDDTLWGKTTEQKMEVSWGEIFSYSLYSNTGDKFGFLSKLTNKEYNENAILSNNFMLEKSSSNNIAGINDATGLVFSFPGFKRKGGGLFGTGDGATAPDMNRAYDVSTTLINNLNTVISTTYTTFNNKSIKTVDDLVAASMKIRPTEIGSDWAIAKLVNGYEIWYALKEDTTDTRSNLSYSSKVNISALKDALPMSDNKNNLYAYLVNTNKLDKTSVSRLSGFVWAMPKGYLDVKDGSPVDGAEPYSLTGTEIIKNADTLYMTIFHYSFFANYNYLWNGTSNKTSVNNTSDWLQKSIYNLFATVMAGIKASLGLENMHDLVYNGGVRGTSSYEDGTMNSQWWNTVLKYHLIFQIIAWMLIGVAVAKTLVEMNISTVNPQVRMSYLETLQKLFTVGFLLALAIPIIRFLVQTNNFVVDIFKTQAQTDTEAFTMNGSLASIASYAAYFGILIIINCIYIMRSIMIAILSASAPFFIVSMAFSTKGKGLFSTWFQEISANIFMQSIHAFSFAFLFEVIDSGKLIQKLVVFWSLIPITDTFRGLIFQKSGDFASSQGAKMGHTVGALASNTGKGFVRGISSARTERMAEKFDVEGALANKNGSGGTNSQIGEMQKRANVLNAMANNTEKEGNLQSAAGLRKGAAGAKVLGNSMAAFGAIGDFGVSNNLGDTHGAIDATKKFGTAIQGLTHDAFMGLGNKRNTNEPQASKIMSMEESDKETNNKIMQNSGAAKNMIMSSVNQDNKSSLYNPVTNKNLDSEKRIDNISTKLNKLKTNNPSRTKTSPYSQHEKYNGVKEYRYRNNSGIDNTSNNVLHFNRESILKSNNENSRLHLENMQSNNEYRNIAADFGHFLNQDGGIDIRPSNDEYIKNGIDESIITNIEPLENVAIKTNNIYKNRMLNTVKKDI